MRLKLVGSNQSLHNFRHFLKVKKPRNERRKKRQKSKWQPKGR